MTVLLSELYDLFPPVGIVVVLLIFGKSRVVVQFDYIGGQVAQRRVEISFFEHHGVLISGQHIESFGLMRSRKFVGIGEPGRPPDTPAGFDHYNPIGPLRTPDSGSSSILENSYAFDIFHIDVQQLSKALLVSRSHIKIGLIDGLHIIVYYNQGFRIGIDGRHTSQTH